MAMCDECKREMLTADGCDEFLIRIKGKLYKPIKYGDEAEDWGAAEGARCHDCACKPGNYHHPGCDVERCPACGRQLISCDCLDFQNADYKEA